MKIKLAIIGILTLLNFNIQAAPVQVSVSGNVMHQWDTITYSGPGSNETTEKYWDLTWQTSTPNRTVFYSNQNLLYTTLPNLTRITRNEWIERVNGVLIGGYRITMYTKTNGVFNYNGSLSISDCIDRLFLGGSSFGTSYGFSGEKHVKTIRADFKMLSPGPTGKAKVTVYSSFSNGTPFTLDSFSLTYGQTLSRTYGPGFSFETSIYGFTGYAD